MRRVLALASSEIGGKDDVGIKETTDSLISEDSDDKLTDDSVSAGSTSPNNTPAVSIKGFKMPEKKEEPKLAYVFSGSKEKDADRNESGDVLAELADAVDKLPERNSTTQEAHATRRRPSR